jgi:NitT/TauT family transport system substrate-binding protein
MFGIIRLFCVLPVALSALLGAGCGPGDRERQDSASSPARIKVRMASIETVGQNEVPYTMKHFGIDAKYGFDVEIIPYSTPGQQYNMARTGAVDVISGNFIDLLRQRNGGGAQLRAFHGFQSFSMLVVVPPDSTITSFADLRGKRVGAFGTTFLDWLILRAAGKVAYGYDIEEEAELTMTSPQLLNVLLEQGRIDAAFQFNPLTIVPVADGQQRVVTSIPKIMKEAGFDPASIYLAWMTTDAWIEAHPGALERFQAATREAYEKLRTDDAIWEPLAAFIGITKPANVARYRDHRREVGDPPFTPELIEPTQRLLDALVALKGEAEIGVSTVDPAAFAFPRVAAVGDE